MKVVWTEQAWGRLLEIERFIARDDASAATRLVDKLIDRGDSLKEHPRRGRRLPELPESGLREYRFESCLRHHLESTSQGKTFSIRLRGSCYTDVTAFRRRFPHHTFMKTVYGGFDMKTSRIVAIVLAALLAATTTLPAQETRPVVSAETSEDALECAGEGLINVVADQCMHDGGGSSPGDSLEIYCYHGTARFCLSGEECPWRGESAGGINETCSRAGLDDEWMATAWCDGWSGFHDFACTERGQIKLQKEGRAVIPAACGEPD